MKKFLIIFMTLLLALFCLSGCKMNTTTTTSTEIPVNTEMPESGIVVTVDPVEETAAAEQILNENINK